LLDKNCGLAEVGYCVLAHKPSHTHDELPFPNWSPAYLYLVNKIEWVQKSFTKRLNSLSAMSYSDRLIWLGAESLATRRLKFDLVLFYDITHITLTLIYRYGTWCES